MKCLLVSRYGFTLSFEQSTSYLPTQQVSAPDETGQDWNEFTGMIEGAKRHDSNEDDMNEVKQLKALSQVFQSSKRVLVADQSTVHLNDLSGLLHLPFGGRRAPK